jgi:hypothetical protein
MSGMVSGSPGFISVLTRTTNGDHGLMHWENASTELQHEEFEGETGSEADVGMTLTDNYDLEAVASLPFSEKWSWFMAQMQVSNPTGQCMWILNVEICRLKCVY